jgi:DNA polymerase-1
VKALIDADQLAFACAASAEDETVEVGCQRADTMLHKILHDMQADTYECWLSGGNNFRYAVFPEYKIGRVGAYRPKWEHEVKDHLRAYWKALDTDGIEADDMLGIRAGEVADSILAHLDKDINQIKGKHYNWDLWRNKEIIRPWRIYDVSQEEADYWFFYQLLVGDSVDGVKGIPGIGPKKAAGILYGCESNQERYEAVLDRYSSEEELDMNARCVYIWRKHDDNWRNILEH